MVEQRSPKPLVACSNRVSPAKIEVPRLNGFGTFSILILVSYLISFLSIFSHYLSQYRSELTNDNANPQYIWYNIPNERNHRDMIW